MRARLAAAAVVVAAGVAAAAPAQAGITPYPVPCTDCSYVAASSCTMSTPGFDDTLYAFTRFTVDGRGRVHVRTVSWAGWDKGGPEALDRVYAHVRISGGGEPVTGVRVWDPAGTDGIWRAVDKANGRTARGLEVNFQAHSDGETCSVTVTPRSLP